MTFLSGLTRWGEPRGHPRGTLHLARGEFAAAAAYFEGVLAGRRDLGNRGRRLASSRAALARAHLGLACFHAGDYPGAEREFSRALRADPGLAGLRYLRARVFERAGLLVEAVEDLETALAAQPRHLEAHLLLAVCLEQLGEGTSASQALDRALGLGIASPGRLAPSRIATHGFAGRRRPPPAVRRDTRAGASEAERQALEPRPDGLLAGAVAALTRVVAERPSFADLRCRLAALLFDAGRPAEALEQVDAALAINPRYLDARLLAVRACLERGEADLAAGHAASLVGEHPDYPDLHVWLGLARFGAGDLSGAAAALEQAIALHRQFARAHRLLGLVHLALGRREEAMRGLRRGLVRDRELPPAALESALPPTVLDGAEREGELARALAVRPDYPDLHLALARARRARGDLAGAAAACRAALALAPGFGAAGLELADVTLALGQPAAAEAALETLARRHPEWADVHALLGRTRLARGDAVAAEPALRAALHLNPRFGAARADLGWALRAQARARDADAEFARALALDRSQALPRRRLAWREGLPPEPVGVA